MPDDAFNVDADGDHNSDDGPGAERIPQGFAPSNVQNISGSLSPNLHRCERVGCGIVVNYAKQDPGAAAGPSTALFFTARNRRLTAFSAH